MEQSKIKTTRPAIGNKQQTVLELFDQKHRLASLNLAVQIAIPVAIVTFIFYLGLYFWTEAQPMFVAAVGPIAILIAAFAARHFSQRDQLNKAGYWLIFSLVIFYAVLELAWFGGTLYIAVAGILTILLVGILTLPQQWYIWLTANVLFGIVLWLINFFMPFGLRYNIIQLPLLLGYLILLTIIVLVAYIWQGFRFFEMGNIRTRLLIALVGTVLLAVIVVSVSSILVGFVSEQEQIIQQLESVAALKKSEVDTWTSNLNSDLRVLETQTDIIGRIRNTLLGFSLGEVNKNLLRAELTEHLELTRRFNEVFIMDLDGEVILSTDATQEGENRAEETYFQTGLEEAVILPPSYDSPADDISIVVVRPIQHPLEEGTIGVLAGRTDMERLSQIMLERTGFGESGETYLVDTDKRLLTESLFENYDPLETVVDTAGVNQALELREQINTPDFSEVTLYEDYRGIPIVGVYRWLPELEVVLLAEQDQAEAFQLVSTTIVSNIVVALGTILAAVLVGLFVTRSIAVPLSNLSETATKIAGGDFGLQATIERNDEIGSLAYAFNKMTEQLQNLIGTLEERVQKRTFALEVGATISREIVTILDRDELLRFVVNNLKKEFDFYHVHIYLIEESTDDLIMTEGFGEVGRQLKKAGHRLQMGQGIVGTVAHTNKHFLSNDVSQVPNFVRNRLLPKTNSELAVPLRKGGQVLGVLDIQSQAVNRFRPEDLSLMQSIANQTAVALDNIRLLAETQQALREVERLNRQLTREVWEKFGDEIHLSGYRFSKGTSLPVLNRQEFLLPPMKLAARNRQMIKENHPGNGGSARAELAVPLMLRGQVIGVLGVKREEVPSWADEEVSAVESVADQIAKALENARLSKEQEKIIEQLKEVDRLKSEFLTSMSHELRTPLNSIIGFSDVLLQGIDGDLPEMAINDVQLIYNSGQHLLALINDILDLSKIEAGKMELVREPTDVKNETIRDVLSASHSLIKDKPVEMVVEIEDDLPLVYADKLRIRQILLNLVSNAAKFTHEGTITIRTTILDETEMMRISVIDTGIGIPPEKAETVFDRFRQADSSTTRVYGGTGLGLAICKQLVEMHGGELGVESEVDTGSEFFFTVPIFTDGIEEKSEAEESMAA